MKEYTEKEHDKKFKELIRNAFDKTKSSYLNYEADKLIALARFYNLNDLADEMQKDL